MLRSGTGTRPSHLVRTAWVVLGVGILFVTNPLYVELIAGTGKVVALDWLAAIGVTRTGTYYIAVGMIYVFIGLFTLYAPYDERYDHSTLATLASAWLALALYALALVSFIWNLPIGIGTVVLGLATGPVLFGFLIGEAADPWHKKLIGASLLLTAPYTGFAIVNAFRQGAVTTVGGLSYILSLVLLVMLNHLWGYPLYLLGRLVREQQKGWENIDYTD